MARVPGASAWAANRSLVCAKPGLSAPNAIKGADNRGFGVGRCHLGADNRGTVAFRHPAFSARQIPHSGLGAGGGTAIRLSDTRSSPWFCGQG
jgi:hypothetical protein